MRYLEQAFRTIEKFDLVEEGDRIFVALSGGKDSAAALFVLKEYVEKKGVDCEIKGIHLSFDLPISANVERVVRQQADLANVELVVISLKELGLPSLTDVLKRTSRPLCSICGVLKRYLLNKLPREMGATKVATGHNLDDFLVFYFKNVLGGNFSWISKFKPKLEASHPKLVCKIRPLFFLGNKENLEFCRSRKIPLIEEDVCPHTLLCCKVDTSREKWYEVLEEIEKRQRGFRLKFAEAVVKMASFFPSEGELRECEVCGEPTSQAVCAFCKLFRKV